MKTQRKFKRITTTKNNRDQSIHYAAFQSPKKPYTSDQVDFIIASSSVVAQHFEHLHPGDGGRSEAERMRQLYEYNVTGAAGEIARFVRAADHNESLSQSYKSFRLAKQKCPKDPELSRWLVKLNEAILESGKAIPVFAPREEHYEKAMEILSRRWLSVLCLRTRLIYPGVQAYPPNKLRRRTALDMWIRTVGHAPNTLSQKAMPLILEVAQTLKIVAC